MTRAIRLAALAAILVPAGLSYAAPASAAGPTAIGVDSKGTVYAGFASGLVKRFTGGHGKAKSPWTNAGSGVGQTGGIVAIDAAPGEHGNVWVLDTNLRVQELTRKGVLIKGTQLDPCTPGITPDPTIRGGLDVTNDAVYVAHPCADQVLKLDPSSLAVEATATVAGPKGVSAQLYDTAPRSTRRVYVAQPVNGTATKLGLNNLDVKGTMNVKGSPSDVFVDAYGVLFVADVTGDFIYQYDSSGRIFRTLGRPGGQPGDLNRPMAIDVFDQYSGLAGNIFIADYGNSRVQRWNSYGYTYWAVPAADTGGGGGGPGAPLNTVRPAIQGDPAAGATVTCTTGSWSNGPTAFAFAWARDGTPISGATHSSYAIQNADVGHSLTCSVTASNPSGSASATSDAVTPHATGSAPVNATPPQIQGTPAVGNQLTCTQGTWQNSPTSFSYSWRRDGASLASGSTYTVQAADVGHALTCVVTATNTSGSSSATSAPVTPTGSPSGAVGVSINGGALATNSPSVVLSIHEPAGATNVVISNDGGFTAAQTLAIAANDTYPWTLASSGAGDRLPKTVYVRFRGPGINQDQTFTDDIILDQRSPLMMAATLLTHGRSVGSHRLPLQVLAKDEDSGVAELDVAARRSGPYESYPYRKLTTIRHPSRAFYARVVDMAGNPSRWVDVRTSRR
jgi:hypothetical protein